MQVTHVSMEKFGKDKAWTYIECFTKESTERWIRMFAGYRYDTIIAIDELNLNDDKVYNNYRKDFIRGFTSEMKELIRRKKSLLRSDENVENNLK